MRLYADEDFSLPVVEELSLPASGVVYFDANPIIRHTHQPAGDFGSGFAFLK
jgi:hypothetical protein